MHTYHTKAKRNSVIKDRVRLLSKPLILLLRDVDKLCKREQHIVHGSCSKCSKDTNVKEQKWDVPNALFKPSIPSLIADEYKVFKHWQSKKVASQNEAHHLERYLCTRGL